MNSQRQNKINRMLQKELADIFLREGREITGQGMITVTGVRVSADLSVAKVYISLFATKDKEQLLDNIAMQTRKIRNFLAQRIRNQVKKIPELQFFEDDSLDYIEKIDHLLNKDRK